MAKVLQLVQPDALQVKVQDRYIPRLRLNKMPCELCGLMAEHATWTISGEGGARHVWLHLHCDYCYAHADFTFAHALKIGGYERRKALAPYQLLAQVMGL